MNTLKLLKTCRLAILFAAVTLASCEKETEQYQTAPLSDYLPLKPGKYITYRVDSTIFTNFGTATAVRSYQEKHLIDTLSNDLLGRPSYRVFRQLRDTAGTEAWRPSGTYMITVGTSSIEYIENNLRSVRLSLPVAKDYSWMGNGFMPTSPYTDLYHFTVDNNIQSWNYRYAEVDGTQKYKGQTLTDVLTVKQIDDSANVPITGTTQYAWLTRAIDKYAKGIGLVDQELTLWEYQFDLNRGSGYKVGFGVKRTMIDHN
jgi:hypothetical protein